MAASCSSVTSTPEPVHRHGPAGGEELQPVAVPVHVPRSASSWRGAVGLIASVSASVSSSNEIPPDQDRDLVGDQQHAARRGAPGDRVAERADPQRDVHPALPTRRPVVELPEPPPASRTRTGTVFCDARRVSRSRIPNSRSRSRSSVRTRHPRWPLVGDDLGRLHGAHVRGPDDHRRARLLTRRAISRRPPTARRPSSDSGTSMSRSAMSSTSAPRTTPSRGRRCRSSARAGAATVPQGRSAGKFAGIGLSCSMFTPRRWSTPSHELPGCG